MIIDLITFYQIKYQKICLRSKKCIFLLPHTNKKLKNIEIRKMANSITVYRKL